MSFGQWGEYWTVLIGDVVDSRGAPDRADLQRRLQSCLEQVNEHMANKQHRQPDPSYYKGLAGRLQITVGDEVQGIFAWPDDALRAAITLWEDLAPQRIDFGIGWGRLETDLDRTHIGRNDGPCFHNARAAWQAARAHKDMVQVEGFGSFFLFEPSMVGPEDTTINPILTLTGALRARWTPRQTEIVRMLRRHQLRAEAAHALGVQPSTVTESLQASLFSQIDAAEQSVAAMLRETASGMRQGPVA